MAQFSIKEAISVSIAVYIKHYLLLLMASVLMASSLWLTTFAPLYVSEKLSAQSVILLKDKNAVGALLDQAKANALKSTKTEKIENFFDATRVYLKKTPKHQILALIFVTILAWALYFFLMLGGMKLGLTINDKGMGSWKVVFSTSFNQLMRFFLASFFMVLWFIMGMVVILCISIFINFLARGVVSAGGIERGAVTDFLVPFIHGLGLFFLIGLLLYTLLDSLFYGYCIVDNPQITALNALTMSRTITKGSLWRIIGAGVVFAIVAGCIGFIIGKLILTGGPFVLQHGEEITRFVNVILIIPFSIPYFSYVYRMMNPIK